MATNDLFLQLLRTSSDHYSLYGDYALDIIDSTDGFYIRNYTKADLEIYKSLPEIDSKYVRINQLINKRITHIEANLNERIAEFMRNEDSVTADSVTADSVTADTISNKSTGVPVVALYTEEIEEFIHAFDDYEPVTSVEPVAPVVEPVEKPDDGVSTKPDRSFCNKPFVLSQFLSEMHLYTLNDIVNIINEHKSELDSLYGRFIISMHTGKRYDDTADEINDRLIYAMLCGVNEKIVKLNLNYNCGKLVQKYVSIYGTPEFDAKDLALEILQTKYKGGTECITHLAKSYFSYLELLQTGLIIGVNSLQAGFAADVHKYS
jgi:hypothetical protein